MIGLRHVIDEAIVAEYILCSACVDDNIDSDGNDD